MRLTKLGLWTTGVVLALLFLLGLSAVAKTINVPTDYKSISEAVAAAAPGDTIVVAMQNYDPSKESYPINIAKALTIECIASGDKALKVPPSHAGFVVRANGVMINGCSLNWVSQAKGKGDIGVVVKDVTSGVVIKNLTITNMDVGIKLINASGVILQNNNISNVTGAGIMLEGSEENTLSGNKVSRQCGEGLFLFGSNGNIVTGDTYSGCTTNGVTINDSVSNILTGLTVRNNTGWGVDISLSDYNEVNGSEISWNKAGGVKIEGGVGNLVSNPKKQGNFISSNGDGQDQDIQVLITSGEKVLFTVPDFLKVPNDPFDTAPNDVRTEARILQGKVEELAKKFTDLDRELLKLRQKMEAEWGSINNLVSLLGQGVQTSSQQFQAEKDFLFNLQEEIALEKFIIFACKVGPQGEFDHEALPDWERELVEAWIDGDYDKDGEPNEIPDDLCVKASKEGLVPAIFFVSLDPETHEVTIDRIEEEKQEIKDEIERIGDGTPEEPKGLKQKLFDLKAFLGNGLYNQLLGKLNAVVGIVGNVNAELESILGKLVYADNYLPSREEKEACLALPTVEEIRDCLKDLLPWVMQAKLLVEDALKEIPQIFDGKLEKRDDRQADKLDRMLFKIADFSRELPPPPFEVNCLNLGYDPDKEPYGCLIGKKEKGGAPISQGEIDDIRAELVERLNNDPQAKEFRKLLDANGQGTGEWQEDHILVLKRGTDSHANVVANNVITAVRENESTSKIPERHRVLWTVERKGSNIGIVIESDQNILLNNVISNDLTDNQGRSLGRRMDIGIIILSDENQVFFNTCEKIDTCIIRGGNNDRDDVQHEHLFTKLAAAASYAVEDPLEWQWPAEKIIVLGEVKDVPIHVAAPHDKCLERQSNPNFDCADSSFWPFKSITVQRNEIYLNFFHRNGIDIDNVDVWSNYIYENLFMESANGVLARMGAATGFALLHNDFIYGAITNWDKVALNASPNYMQGGGVIGNVVAPQASDPFCQTQNFGNQKKFSDLESKVKALNAAASFAHYYSNGGLPPAINYLPDGVKLPQDKPRTCADATGAIPPTPGEETLSQILDDMGKLLSGGSIIPNLQQIAALLLTASKQNSLTNLLDKLDDAEDIKLDLLVEMEDFRGRLLDALEHPDTTSKVRALLLSIERLLDRLEAHVFAMNDFTDEAAEQTSLSRARSKVRLARAKALTAIRTAQSIAKQLAKARNLVNGTAAAALELEPLQVSAFGLSQDRNSITFQVQGSGIAGISVQIFNLQGRAVFSEEAYGTMLRFYGLSDRGEPLANGVYLYVVTAKGYDGSVVRSEVRKLVILR